MACGVSYSRLSRANSYALNALMNEVTKDAGLGARCPEETLHPPPEGDCVDAPSWGSVNGVATTWYAHARAINNPGL